MIRRILMRSMRMVIIASNNEISRIKEIKYGYIIQ